jgi:hypothetical protein
LAAGLTVAAPGTANADPPNCIDTKRITTQRVDVYDHRNGYAVYVSTTLWGCNTSVRPYLVAEGRLFDVSQYKGFIEMRILGLHLEWRRASDAGGFGFLTGINSGTPWVTQWISDYTNPKYCSDGYPTQYEYRAKMLWQVRWENGALSDPHPQEAPWVRLCR